MGHLVPGGFTPGGLEKPSQMSKHRSAAAGAALRFLTGWP
jgi:hypothetical protein